MTYLEFRDLIRYELEKEEDGLTWRELRKRARLPYERPCPNWTRRLEGEIGLQRHKRLGSGNSLVWTISG
jgi:hypothetical protein